MKTREKPAEANIHHKVRTVIFISITAIWRGFLSALDE